MKVRLSEKGKAILKNANITNAIVQAIIAHPNEFTNGMAVPVEVSERDAQMSLKKSSFSVQLTSSVNRSHK